MISKFPSLIYYIVSISILLLYTSCNKQTEYIYGDKVWVHRANDINKARALQYQYAGLEVDVFFNNANHCFMIKHDVYEESKISLNQWLDSLDNRRNLGLWLDLRNLTPENKDDIIDELLQIRRHYKLKSRVVVESMSFNCLKDIEKYDFDISYYIPKFNPDTSSASFLELMRDSIASAVADSNIPTISGYYYQYDFMKKHFPDLQKLIWYYKDDAEMKEYFLEIARRDPKIEILLLGVSEW